MTLHAKPTFPHRHNRDGVIDSICSDCLLTVASSLVQCELYRLEESHVCDPIRIDQLWAYPSRRQSSDTSHSANSRPIRHALARFC